MNKLSFVLLFIITFFAISETYSQRPQYNGENFSGKIKGIIVDGETNSPLEYASVAILKRKDSTIVNGVLTDYTGSFTFDNLTPGMYILKFSFVGYKNAFKDSILVTPRKPLTDLGRLPILTSNQKIGEVVVRGSVSPIMYKIDKKVVDVSQNVVAAGGTVVDALQNTPSVQTDIEGNLTLRGSSNYVVLIDGRPSPLAGSEALQQIPASIVQNVEIITNPSAKYDAEGSAGIINVVMKKQKIKGMNGIINATVGTRDKNSVNANFNYKFSSLNFTLGVDYSDMTFHMNSLQNKIDTLSQNKLRNQLSNETGIFHRYGMGLKGGIEYIIDDRNSINFSGSFGERRFGRSSNIKYFDKTSNELSLVTDSAFYLNNSGSKGLRDYGNMNLEYLLKFNESGHQLAASIFFSQGPDNHPNILYQSATDKNWQPFDKDDTINYKIKQIKIIQNTDETELRSKIDYTYPFNEKGKLEAGYQGRYNLGNGTYKVDTGSNWSEYVGLRDKFDFSDNMQEVYTTFANSMNLFDYQVGLRAAYEKRNINLIFQNKQYNMKRLDFFPTIHLSRKLPWDLQVQASYTRRIDRPRDWDLNPKQTYVDMQTVRVGNPDLLPQFTNSYEFNIQKQINDASFVSAEGFLRQTNNKIQQIYISDTVSEIKTITSTNLDHDRSIGVEFMLNLAPAKFLNFNASWSIYNYRLYGKLFSANANSNNTWNLRINPTLRLSWGTSMQINYTYNAPTIEAQGTRSGSYSTSIGIRQELFKRKGSLTLQMQNPIGRTRMTNTTRTNNIYSHGWFERESQVYMLTFSYRINNYKVQQAKKIQDDSNGSSEMDMNGM
jgi:outer membrane receptor protein involved in Fe transport